MTEPRFAPGRVVEVRVQGRPPGANALHRMGHWGVTKVRAEWKGKTHDAAVRSVLSGPYSDPWLLREGWPLQHASLEILWRCKYRRRRDFDNLVSGVKPLLDGLVSAGIIEDDNSEVLVQLGPLRVEVGADMDETVLMVTEEIPWQT